MGKGQIISGGADGEYQVKLLLDRRRVNSEQFGLTRRIAAVAAEAAAMDAGTERDKKELQQTALEKREDFIQSDMPADPTVAAWCADLTENLSGIVGTIEVPGERGTVLIQPGYDGNAAYDSERDGVLQPSIAGTSESVYFNWALRPGWQKWWPTYRFGVITALSGDTCDLRLYNAQSSDQGLQLNQTTTLSNVSIEYMTCNGGAFSLGDEVLVKFEGQRWGSPKVIGFKDNPQPCLEAFYIRLTIDSNTLYYGGQQISITYTKTDTSEATTAAKSIHGGGDSPDSQKHYLAGPFDLEDWDGSSDILVNLLRERDLGAMSSVPSSFDWIVSFDCKNGPGETKAADDPPGHRHGWEGLDKMFDYFIVDLISPEYRSWVYRKDLVHNITGGEFYECGEGPEIEEYEGGSPGDTPVASPTITFHYQKIGITDDEGSPPTDYEYDTLKYRRATKISERISAVDFLGNIGAEETVYNWGLAGYEDAQVWELNVDFGLKQVHYLWWHDNTDLSSNPRRSCIGGTWPDYDGTIPSTYPGWRKKQEYWNNDLDVGIANADAILSLPWVTYSDQDIWMHSQSGISHAHVREFFGGYGYDQSNNAACEDWYYYPMYSDWTPAATLDKTTPPILIIGDEENYSPSLPLQIDADTSHSAKATKYDTTNGCDFVEPIDIWCEDEGFEEIPQLCEMVSTLSYWY